MRAVDVEGPGEPGALCAPPRVVVRGDRQEALLAEPHLQVRGGLAPRALGDGGDAPRARAAPERGQAEALGGGPQLGHDSGALLPEPRHRPALAAQLRAPPRQLQGREEALRGGLPGALPGGEALPLEAPRLLRGPPLRELRPPRRGLGFLGGPALGLERLPRGGRRGLDMINIVIISRACVKYNDVQPVVIVTSPLYVANRVSPAPRPSVILM